MAVTLHDLLQPQVVMGVVSRVKRARGRLSEFFGFLPSQKNFDERSILLGPNVKKTPNRTGTYRIFDRTRTIAEGRAPGTGPALVSHNPVGEVAYSCVRYHEKIRLFMEELDNLSTIVGPNSAIDPGGQDYVAKQIEHEVARIYNAIELAAAGMIRGQLYLNADGENWTPGLSAGSGASFTVNFQIPSGNKSQLNMLGGGSLIGTSWTNDAAPILSDLGEIDAAMVQLTGYSLSHVWCNSQLWALVINNTQVQEAAGSANTPFQSYERTKEKGFDGQELAEYTAVLRGYPHVTWHIYNHGLVLGGTDPSYSAGTGTFTKIIPDNTAVFMPEPDNEWVDALYCGEHVSENPGQPAVMREGFHFWTEYRTQPTCIELLSLFNGLPRLKVPKAIAYGTVAGF